MNSYMTYVGLYVTDINSTCGIFLRASHHLGVGAYTVCCEVGLVPDVLFFS